MDNQLIEQLNSKAKQLNAERQRTLGMKESAKKSYDKLVASYEQKYGVHLDVSTLQAEYNRVKQQLDADAVELQKLITDIENGVYTQKAEPTIEPSVQGVSPTQPTPTTTPMQPTQVPPITQPFVQATGAHPTAKPNVQPTQVPPTQVPPFAPTSPTVFGQPSASYGGNNQHQVDMTAVHSTIEQLETVKPSTPTPDVPLTPPGWGNPTTPTPNVEQPFVNFFNKN